jgi:hypothetical protein
MSDTSIGSAPIGQASHGSSSLQPSRTIEEGKREVRHQIDDRTTQAGREVRSFAQALRRSGSELQGEAGGTSMSRVTSGVADRLERFGGYLEGAKGDDLLRDGERFARERPWLVAGAAALVGFTASRLMKASSERRYDSDRNGGGSRPGSSWDRTETAGMHGSESDWIEPSTVVTGSASH